jgi:heme/copper-type cytochrome/quinol oxidase subunit 4
MSGEWHNRMGTIRVSAMVVVLVVVGIIWWLHH